MKFKGTIIITDPCYVIKEDKGRQNDWVKCKCGDYMEALGIKHYISEPTIYGDWSCTTWSIPSTDIENHIENLNQINKDIWNAIREYGIESEQYAILRDKYDSIVEDTEKIGRFCADAGLVAVFLLDEVLKYNPDFSKWIEERPWCVTVISDFEGDVKYHIDKDGDAHIIGRGNINFFTSQTGL